jgi:hypothetical protein
MICVYAVWDRARWPTRANPFPPIATESKPRTETLESPFAFPAPSRDSSNVSLADAAVESIRVLAQSKGWKT